MGCEQLDECKIKNSEKNDLKNGGASYAYRRQRISEQSIDTSGNMLNRTALYCKIDILVYIMDFIEVMN